MTEKPEMPGSIQDGLDGIWDALWYARRVTTSRARMWWCVRVRIPKRLGAAGREALDDWWLRNHYRLTGAQKRWRRRHGLGNVFLIRCADQALVLTNGGKAFAYELLQQIRREAFWERFHSLPHMNLVHLADGVELCDLHVQYRKPQAGGDRRIFIRPTDHAIEEFKRHVRAITRRREGQSKWARKARTIVTQYNDFIRSWWGRMQWCDWEIVMAEPSTAKSAKLRRQRQRPEHDVLERWARRRVYYKVRQEVIRHEARRMARARYQDEAPEGVRPRIQNPRGFASALYRRLERLGPKRIWRGSPPRPEPPRDVVAGLLELEEIARSSKGASSPDSG